MSSARIGAVESLCRRNCDDFIKVRGKPKGSIEIWPGVRKNIVPVTTSCRKYGYHLDTQHGPCAIDKCPKTIKFMREHPCLENWEKKELGVMKRVQTA